MGSKLINYCVHESEAEKIVFEHHDYSDLINATNGCKSGCHAGVLIYRQTDFIQGGVHNDQEGFYVLEGCGKAKVGEIVFDIRPGSCFIAPPGEQHYICRNKDSVPVKLFFFHAAVIE